MSNSVENLSQMSAEDVKGKIPQDESVTAQESEAERRNSQYDADSSDNSYSPPTKKTRCNNSSRYQQLQDQINALASLIVQGSSSALVQNETPDNFLTRPAESKKILDFGELKTDIDEKKAVLPALKERLDILNILQRFGSSEWKEVRYSNTLRNFTAFPGFTDLRVNEELCYLDRKKDPILATERVLAGLSNAILEQKDVLKISLQEIVDWAFSNPRDFNPNTLFDKLSSAFGSGSQMLKNFDQIMQVICGKRAECIENRRERLLSELQNKNVQAALRRIPPSSEYLFSKEKLAPLIQSLGGSQNWLNTPSYMTTKRPLQKKDSVPSGSGNNRTFQPSGKSFQAPKYRYDPRKTNSGSKGGAKKGQTNSRTSDSFRKKSTDN